MGSKALVLVWMLLALVTLFLLVHDNEPRWIIALSAWCGGLVTTQMYRTFRGGSHDQ